MGFFCDEWKYGNVLAIVKRSEVGLYEVRLLFLFGIGMMLASFQICGMMLVC